MPGPAVDGVWAAMGRPRAGHARPLQGGSFCSGRRPQRPAEGSRPLPTVLVEKQVPFGLLGSRGRTCPARLWMVYGWLWEGRGPGMPGPYRAAVGEAGGIGKARQSPSGRLRLPLTFIILPGLRSPPARGFPPAAERSHPDTPDCPRWSGSARRFLPARHRGRRADRRSRCRRPGRPGRPAIQSVPRPGWRWPGQWQPARR